MYPGQEKIIKEHYQKNPAELTKLRGPIFEDKVMNLIIEKSQVKVKTITKDELSKLIATKDKSITIEPYLFFLNSELSSCKFDFSNLETLFVSVNFSLHKFSNFKNFI